VGRPSTILRPVMSRLRSKVVSRLWGIIMSRLQGIVLNELWCIIMSRLQPSSWFVYLLYVLNELWCIIMRRLQGMVIVAVSNMSTTIRNWNVSRVKLTNTGWPTGCRVVDGHCRAASLVEAVMIDPALYTIGKVFILLPRQTTLGFDDHVHYAYHTATWR